jgi:FKBP-type peptidyl-prolyl cis-trans isomerase
MGEVIAGWDWSQGMRQGGVRHLTVPPAAGHGVRLSLIQWYTVFLGDV